MPQWYCVDSDGDGVIYKGHWDRLNAGRQWILASVASQLTTKTKLILPGDSLARFEGIHAGKGLTHGSREGAFHCSRLDRLAAEGNCSCLVALGKHLQLGRVI
jgi:hypothetical protein